MQIDSTVVKKQKLDFRLSFMPRKSQNFGPPDNISLQKILVVDDQSFNIDAAIIIMNTCLGLDTENLVSIAYNGRTAL